MTHATYNLYIMYFYGSFPFASSDAVGGGYYQGNTHNCTKALTTCLKTSQNEKNVFNWVKQFFKPRK